MSVSEDEIVKFCKNLKSLRQAANWTQEDLAKKAGVTRQTIASIENGKMIPSKTLFIAIAGIFTVMLPFLPIVTGVATAIGFTGITKWINKK